MTFLLDWTQLHTLGELQRWSGYFPCRTNATQVHNDPMTAIVAVHTPDGFIIGADGRRMDREVITTEQAKKLFWFESETIRLVYAWSGTTQTFAKNNEILHDVFAASETILPIAAFSGKDSFASFVDVFCKVLYKTLPARITNMSREELARVLFVGYFQGQPCSAKIELLYSNSFLTPDVEIHIPAQFYRSIFSGAESVFLKSYANCEPQSSAEAIDFVRNYIQDCVDSPAPDCIGIGGHIHIAELTPERFSWVVSPITE